LLLTIEKLIYGGDGLAHLPADESGRGKAAFVPFVLSGEKVEVSLTQQKPGFARAKAEAIVEASPHRIRPICPYFGSCGGCHYQHASYEHQLEIKREVLRENLRRIAKLDLQSEIHLHASQPWNYRNRSRLQIRVSPSFAIGYFKTASRDLQVVEECPISSPLINRGIRAVWRIGNLSKTPPGGRELEFFADAEDRKLLINVFCTAEARRSAVREWAEELRAAMPEISGVVAFGEQLSKSKSDSEAPFLILGDSDLTYRTQGAAHRVSAGAFFQTNRHLTSELANIVTQGQSGELAFDLYAGVGLFSTALVSNFRHIVSVESSQISAGDLAYNLPSHGEVLQATTEQFLSRWESTGRVGKGVVPAHLLHMPDLAVVDPPRSGLGEHVARLLSKTGAPRIVYVSCDPATLARDLVPLLTAGYRVEQAHLVDMFPQTYHVESVLHLVR
jgi:23S rRNA (uracil1939-C5)-methyltransferase